jgi:TctA family transporter
MIKSDGNFLSFFERPVAARLRIVTIGIIAMLFVSLKHKEE